MENLENSLVHGPEAEGRYSERENINGVDIEISWNDNFDRYGINFPQIKPDNIFLKRVGVRGSGILLTADSEIAKEVFALAAKKAQESPNPAPEEVWLAVWEYCKAFPHPAPRKIAA